MAKQQNYQIVIEDKERGILPISPAMPEEGCDMFLATIREQLVFGNAKAADWPNPHKVKILSH